MHEQRSTHSVWVIKGSFISVFAMNSPQNCYDLPVAERIHLAVYDQVHINLTWDEKNMHLKKKKKKEMIKITNHFLNDEASPVFFTDVKSVVLADI